MNEHLRLKQVRRHLRLSQGNLASAIGRKQGSVSDIERGRNSVDGILALLKLRFGVNPSWLKSGTGAMFLPEFLPAEVAGETGTRPGVPYFSREVDDKPAVLPAGEFSLVREPPEYYIDFKPFNDCTAYFPYHGESMYPKYLHGDIIAVKEVENPDIILWGETYLVVADQRANNLRVVRTIVAHDDPERLLLRALNPAFSGDIVIDKAWVRSLYLVKGKITVTV